MTDTGRPNEKFEGSKDSSSNADTSEHTGGVKHKSSQPKADLNDASNAAAGGAVDNNSDKCSDDSGDVPAPSKLSAEGATLGTRGFHSASSLMETFQPYQVKLLEAKRKGLQRIEAVEQANSEHR